MTNEPPLSKLPHLITRADEVRQVVRDWQRAGKRVGLVPTMGALHDGHASLARQSRAECDFTITTIFVNPTQFAPHEDLQKYPRTLDADLTLLGAHNVDVVFAPTKDEMYPLGFSTYVEPPSVALPLEGRCRPHHFRGVTTVVLKLFQMIPADTAYFGQKDFQQALVIRHMVADLNVAMQIQVCPIIRDPDGIAMSSRNRYLNLDERQTALSLSRGLRLAAELFRAGERSCKTLRQRITDVLENGGISRIDYVALADPDTLSEVEFANERTVALIAVHVGSTRLIDNHVLGELFPQSR